MTRWAEETGGTRGASYDERWEHLAASGQDVHGEAGLVSALTPPPSRVLDAGCGTGRVAIELARLGHDVVGVDLDESMLDRARAKAPDLTWLTADLAALDLADQRFDAVVLAGNVVVFLAPGTDRVTVARCAAHLVPDGLLVAGFQLGPGSLRAYDEHCAVAGLTLEDRFATWERQPYAGGDYAISVHRLLA